MRIEWIGHACFRMTAKDGTMVITDPYDETVGADMVPLAADMITMSHEHHDHNCTDMITGSPVILRGTEEGFIGGVKVRAYGSYHDDTQGAKRGKNAIRVFEADGMRIVHMGDQGCMPEAEIIAAISDADVMMIPVGGTYTVDAAGAKAIIDAAKPKRVIPMHVKTQGCGYPIAKVDDFLRLMGAEDAKPVDVIDPETAPAGVLLMQPQADAL